MITTTSEHCSLFFCQPSVVAAYVQMNIVIVGDMKLVRGASVERLGNERRVGITGYRGECVSKSYIQDDRPRRR